MPDGRAGARTARREPGVTLTVYTQDDPAFPAGVGKVVHDADLAVSWHHDIETVPTLMRVEDGVEVERTVGWQPRGLAADHRRTRTRPGPADCARAAAPCRSTPRSPTGCGSASPATCSTPGASSWPTWKTRWRRCSTAAGPTGCRWSRRPKRVCCACSRAPTGRRTRSSPSSPPDLVEVTVEKIAINAVMAGCKPEYLPVVLATVEAACTDEFNIHGVLATTMPVGPVIIVQRTDRHRIGMNAGVNVLGQGNRANLTIGRALQLVVRNVGGGRARRRRPRHARQPGQAVVLLPRERRAFAVGVAAVERGVAAGRTRSRSSPARGRVRRRSELARPGVAGAVVRRVPAHGAAPEVAARLRRHPDRRSRARAACSRRPAGREQLLDALHELQLPGGEEIVHGAGGIAEGVPESVRDAQLPKFRPGGLLLVHAGGGAGLFSMIIAGWANGETGSQPVTREIASMNQVLLDPTGERAVTDAQRLPRPASLDGQTIGLLDITQAPRQRVPRPAREATAGAHSRCCATRSRRSRSRPRSTCATRSPRSATW